MDPPKWLKAWLSSILAAILAAAAAYAEFSDHPFMSLFSAAAGNAWDQAAMKKLAFSGTLVEKHPRGGKEPEDEPLPSGASHEVVVKTTAGDRVSWFTSPMAAGCYEPGDFLVKLPGREFPAVFREGRQLGSSGVPYYLKERLNLADYLKPAQGNP